MSAPEQVPRRIGWLNWPNIVTLARLVFLAPVCWLLVRPTTGDTVRDLLPVVLLAVWASTDWIDGFLARRLGQVSRFGEVLDPIADRLGIAAVAITLALTGLLPWWILGVIAGVDLFVLIIAGPAARRGTLHVSLVGKARTAALLVGIVGLVAGKAIGTDTGGPGPVMAAAALALVIGGTALHVVAGVGYVVTARRLRELERSKG